MAITKSEFEKAFRQAASTEFDYIPLNDKEIDYTFSDTFEKKMQKLMRSEKRKYWYLINTAFKRILVAAVIITVLMIGLLSIEAVRNTLAQLFLVKHETYSALNISGTKEKILKEYGFSEIPDGYREIRSLKDETLVRHKYRNRENAEILLTQQPTAIIPEMGFTAPGNFDLITINDMDVYIYYYNSSYGISWIANWIEDDYFFMLNYDGYLDLEDIAALIKTIE